MALRISVFASKELQVAISLLKGVERETAKYIRQSLKSVTDPEWRAEVLGQTSTAQEVKVLSDTARVQVSNQNITLKSAAIGKSLSGGARPSEIYAAVEFGASRDSSPTTYQATSRKGKRYSVTRHTRRQFRTPSRSGYVVYPAASKIIPRIAALFVQTTIRTFFEVVEKAAGK